jgi:hypothetical protein
MDKIRKASPFLKGRVRGILGDKRRRMIIVRKRPESPLSADY